MFPGPASCGLFFPPSFFFLSQAHSTRAPSGGTPSPQGGKGIKTGAGGVSGGGGGRVRDFLDFLCPPPKEPPPVFKQKKRKEEDFFSCYIFFWGKIKGFMVFFSHFFFWKNFLPKKGCRGPFPLCLFKRPSRPGFFKRTEHSPGGPPPAVKTPK